MLKRNSQSPGEGLVNLLAEHFAQAEQVDQTFTWGWFAAGSRATSVIFFRSFFLADAILAVSLDFAAFFFGLRADTFGRFTSTTFAVVRFRVFFLAMAS